MAEGTAATSMTVLYSRMKVGRGGKVLQVTALAFRAADLLDSASADHVPIWRPYGDCLS